MTKFRLAHGPLLLLLYQAAPLGVQQDSLGRYRVSVGYGTGQWEHEQFSCDGELLSSTPVRHHSAGAQIDAWPNRQLRLTAFAGTTRSTVGATIATDPDYSSPYIERYDGRFGGALMAYEGQKVGVGIGPTRLPGPGGTRTAYYIRLGKLDAGHLRIDVMSPNPALPSMSWGRIGIGVNNGHLRRVGGFMGVGFGPPGYNDKVGLVAEMHFPIVRHFTGQLHALTGSGENATQWNLGVGLRYDFGR